MTVKVYDHLKPKLVQFLDVSSRDAAITQMIDLLVSQKVVRDRSEFYSAISDREKIVTTGIGMGVAIPHAKLAEFNDFFIAIGVLGKGVEWNSLDGTPVRLVFMIGGPDDKQTEYLQLLSGLTLALKDEDRRKKMLLAKTPEQVIEVLKGF